MKNFKYSFYIKTSQGQEFSVGQKTIIAENVDKANYLLNRLELPFHHYSTVQVVNK